MNTEAVQARLQLRFVEPHAEGHREMFREMKRFIEPQADD
jgi:hypothetical protein